MRLFPFIQLGIFIICFVTSVAGQRRFDCNGELLISSSDGKNTEINKPSYIPFSPPSLSILARYVGSYDALGFNPKDNFVYCVEQNTNNIVRLSLYNGVERIGSVAIVDTLKSNAGDCTAEGLYICYDYGLNKMLVFDVVDGFTLLRQIDLFWDPTSPNSGKFKTRLFDFAFDPNNTKTAYSYQGSFDHEDLAPEATRGSMLKINLDFDDPNLGMVTPLGKINTKDVTHIAGFVFSPQSTLYGYGSALSGLNPRQNSLFSINAVQGKISPFITYNPGQILSDACSCPFSLVFTNAVPFEGMFCNNEKKTFVVGFENNSYIPLNDVVLKDTLPEGTIIQSISNSFSGTVDAGTGVGTNILSISGLLIPAKGRLEIRMEVLSVNAKDGLANNRAYLQNLPPRFPSSLASDDPNSSTPNDRSNFFFKTRGLTNLVWKTISPTDCMEANDGKVVVSSPEFMPGQTYEVGLRNKIGWKEYVSFAVIDENNSFTLDSLKPGEYQLFKFRFMNDNCSLSLKDTTIILDAPNDLLDLNVGSNSPICEGASLLLNSMLSPDGLMEWRGPAIFGSEELNPVIENATPNSTGTYTATATYGYCTKKKSLEVEVKKEVNTTIEGESSYCARDTLHLTVFSAKDQGESLKYAWQGPVTLNEHDSTLILPIVGIQQTGYYQVVSTNGACSDTVGMDIQVLPTPTLVLDKTIMTDFCDPLLLFPKITGDSEVTFQWIPSDGLSCEDCPNPQVTPIVKNKYQLIVANQYDCSDSATTQIVLDKSKIAFLPNIFSPTSSSGNKYFSIWPNCVVHFIHRLAIYDRYGNLVFNTTALGPDDTLESWDGLLSGKTASSGVFIWVAKAELVDGSIVFLSGDVTLL